MDQPTQPELITPTVFAGLEGIVAAFSTRNGGTSRPPFDSLNLGLSTADIPDAVAANRERTVQALGFSVDDLVLAHQVHGAEVALIDGIPNAQLRVDGFVTAKRGILLGISAADCAVVLLADPAAGVVGACHAGWRGAVTGVAENTIARMTEIGAVPGRIVAWISPCISRASFEVGPEVAQHFAPDEITPGSGDRSLVDLKRHIRRRLESGGVSPTNLSMDDACTFTDRSRFFSHRRDEGRTGRMLGMIGLAR